MTAGPLCRSLLAAVALATAGAAVGRADPPADLEAATRFEKDRLYLGRVSDFTPLRVGGGDRDVEHAAYRDLMLHAHRFSTADLLGVARKDVGYADLMAKLDVLREDVRFELIRFDGRLKRLKRIGSFPDLADGGVPDRYEAWVFPAGSDNPVCVHLTEAPAGVEPAEDVTPGRPVTVAGYFLKVVEYPSAEPHPKNKDAPLYRRAPLLVGRSLTDAPVPPPETGETVVTKLLPVVVGGGAGLAVTLAALTVWFRRTDAPARAYRRHRDRNPFADPPPHTDPAGDSP